MSEQEKLFTQAELDDIIKERLGREKTRYDSLLKDHTALKGEYDSMQVELREAQKGLQELPVLKRSMLVQEVATAKHVPAEFAGRLVGATKEELEADADKLIANLGQLGKMAYKGMPPTPLGGGEPKKDDKAEDRIAHQLQKQRIAGRENLPTLK